MRIGLVGCVKSKLAVPAPACELYTSPLFKGRRAAVQRSCDRWFILSAAHGLVPPDQVLEPYDVTLTMMDREQRRRWAQQVLAQFGETAGGLAGQTFEVHAGSAYADRGLVEGLRAAGATVELPVAGLTFGQQLAWYRTRPARPGDNAPASTSSSGAPPPARGGSKYAPLTRWLRSQAGPTVEVTFTDLEQVLGAALPASARRHRPWWANTPQAQAHSWLDSEWKVDRVDLAAERVRFVKETADD